MKYVGANKVSQRRSNVSSFSFKLLKFYRGEASLQIAVLQKLVSFDHQTIRTKSARIKKVVVVFYYWVISPQSRRIRQPSTILCPFWKDLHKIHFITQRNLSKFLLNISKIGSYLTGQRFIFHHWLTGTLTFITVFIGRIYFVFNLLTRWVS